MKQKIVSLIVFFALIVFTAVTVRANIKTQASDKCFSYFFDQIDSAYYSATYPCPTTTIASSDSAIDCVNTDNRADSMCNYGAQTVAVYCGVNGNESKAVSGDVTLTRVVKGKGTISYLIPNAIWTKINNVSTDTPIFTSPVADGASVILYRLTGPNGLLQVNGPNDAGGSAFIFSWGGC